MSIPKKLHYIWLGGNPLPEIALKCIESWRKFCPDYEIVRWDESNLNLDICKYVREAYDAKKYAFASDYFRFYTLYNEGGIYLDIDVELLKPIDEFLKCQAFMGFELKQSVNPGLIMGAEKGFKMLEDIIEIYNKRSFVVNGQNDYTTVCMTTTNYLLERGLKLNNKEQLVEGVRIYPTEVFCPKNYKTKKIKMTENTVSIHHYYGSWVEKPTFKKRVKWFLGDCLKLIIGKKNFEKLRKRIKKT